MFQTKSPVFAYSHGIAVILAGFFAALSSAEEVSRYEASHRAMGSQFTIVLYAPDDATARTAFEAAFHRIVALDKALSDYDPRSELSQLSEASPTEKPIAVSDDLWRVLVESEQFHVASDGAFDITVGPLTTLWRNARREQKLPPGDELKSALAAVGFDHVKLDQQRKSVALARPHMRLDLGGIAKGLAVDEALHELRKNKITSALVNGGGDIVASDAPPGRDGWKIGVAPLAKGAAPSIFLSIKNQAIATSGDTWQFVEIDGQRYSHIVDPKTGLGLTHRSSVTVVAPDCMSADALASALSVLGSERGLAMIDKIAETEALVIRQVDGKPTLKSSRGFDTLPKAK